MTDSSMDFRYTIGSSISCTTPAGFHDHHPADDDGERQYAHELAEPSRPTATPRTSSTKKRTRRRRPTTSGQPYEITRSRRAPAPATAAYNAQSAGYSMSRDTPAYRGRSCKARRSGSSEQRTLQPVSVGQRQQLVPRLLVLGMRHELPSSRSPVPSRRTRRRVAPTRAAFASRTSTRPAPRPRRRRTSRASASCFAVRRAARYSVSGLKQGVYMDSIRMNVALRNRS